MTATDDIRLPIVGGDTSSDQATSTDGFKGPSSRKGTRRFLTDPWGRSPAMGSRFPVVIQDDAGLSVMDPHSGLTLTPESDAIGEAFRKAVGGSEFAEALAEGLAGMPVLLTKDHWGRWRLVGEGGEVLQAAPGEGIHLRLAAISAMEGLTTCMAIGTTKDGRKYGIGSAAYVGGIRLSCALQNRRSAKSRTILRACIRRIRARLAAVKYSQKWGEGPDKGCGGDIRPAAMTLTSPTLDPAVVQGVSEAREERRLLASWELLRKRELFKRRVFGGVRGYEITRKVLSDLVILFHPHLHTLLWAQRIRQDVLAIEWWECLCAATWKEYGFHLSDLYSTREALGRAIKACVQVQSIRKKQPRAPQSQDASEHPEALTFEGAVKETLKYMTKAQDVASYITGPHGERVRGGLPTEHLRSEAMRRYPRVFATVGAARWAWVPPEWCERLDSVSDEKWDELLGKSKANAADAKNRSLDSPPINDGASPVVSEALSSTKKKVKVTRPPNLKGLMHTLTLDDWLQELGKRADQATDFYRRGLRNKGFIVPNIALGEADPPSASAKPEQALPASTGITGAA